MLISYITASKVIDIAQYSLMIAEECRLCWLVYTRGKLEERRAADQVDTPVWVSVL